ncbi:hypothetical protein SETIT_9G576100v2 [Setaria italica]|uniref:Uncharacterized protein n=1 Tax=Setaria italica TaxID=4555 RepID=A0A368SX40_SETIT|nr:hypothetical protein SETIT_9G576100v2 [Setaria italica]
MIRSPQPAASDRFQFAPDRREARARHSLSPQAFLPLALHQIRYQQVRSLLDLQVDQQLKAIMLRWHGQPNLCCESGGNKLCKSEGGGSDICNTQGKKGHVITVEETSNK